MQTPVLSIVYFLLASVLGAAGQFLYKEGTERATDGWMSYLINGRIAGGVVCFGTSVRRVALTAHWLRNRPS